MHTHYDQSKTICELRRPDSNSLQLQISNNEADLANTGVLIKVKFLANVETYSIIFRISVTKTDK